MSWLTWVLGFFSGMLALAGSVLWLVNGHPDPDGSFKLRLELQQAEADRDRWRERAKRAESALHERDAG